MKLFSENINYALGWMVVHSLWQATVIAIVFGVLLIFLRKQSAKLRYVVASMALSSVLLSSIGTFTYCYITVNQPVTIDLPSVQTNNSTQKEVFVPNVAEITPATVSPTESKWSVANFRDYFEQNLPLIVLLWLMGVAIFLMRLLGGISYIYYLRTRMNFPPDEYWAEMLQRLVKKAGLTKPIDLLESAMVRTPMVVGYLKPLILFPIGFINRLSEKEVEAILAHEIAHVIRHDYLFNILQSLVEAIFYYHPAVWWMSAQIRDEREIACDEIAIELLHGNSMNYAKALVAIQEMAFFPLTPSLAFVGQSKNQFLMRMQRILNQPQNKFNIMEKLIATIIVLFTLIGLNLAQTAGPKYNYTNVSEGSSLVMGDGKMKTAGFWNAKIENNEVCVTFNNSEKGQIWVTNQCFDRSEFSTLPNQEAEFTLTRAAGTITFKGKFDGDEGYGKQSFATNESFRKKLSEKGISDIDDEFMFNTFLAKADEKYFEQVEKLGFEKVSSDDWRTLLVHRVSVNMIENMLNTFKAKGYSTVNIDDIVNMKIHGVDADFVKEIQSLTENKLSNDDILGAKIHGLNADFANDFKALGYNNLDYDQLIGFKIHGVTPEYIKSFNEVGLKAISADKVMELKIAAVTADFVKEMRQKGYNSTNPQKYIDMKYNSYMNYSHGSGASWSSSPYTPPTPTPVPNPAPMPAPTPPNVGSSDNYSVNGKFGRASHNGEDQWFYGDYKIIEKNEKFTKAYFKGKQMTDKEMKANAAFFKVIKRRIEQTTDAQKDALNAQEIAIQDQQRAMQEQQRAIESQQREIQSQQREIQSQQREIEAIERNTDKNNKAFSWLVRQIVADNYVKTGEKCKVSIDKNSFKVNGKKMPKEVYLRYKSAILSKMKGQNASFDYKLNGVIKGIKDDGGMEFTGTIDLSNEED